MYSAATAAGAFVNLARWSAVVHVPLYVQVVLAASSKSSGVQLLPVLLSAMPFVLIACLVVALAHELPLDDGTLRRSRLR